MYLIGRHDEQIFNSVSGYMSERERERERGRERKRERERGERRGRGDSKQVMTEGMRRSSGKCVGSTGAAVYMCVSVAHRDHLGLFRFKILSQSPRLFPVPFCCRYGTTIKNCPYTVPIAIRLVIHNALEKFQWYKYKTVSMSITKSQYFMIIVTTMTI